MAVSYQYIAHSDCIVCSVNVADLEVVAASDKCSAEVEHVGVDGSGRCRLKINEKIKV